MPYPEFVDASLFFEGREYRVNEFGEMSRREALEIVRNHAPELEEVFGRCFRTVVVSGAAICRWIIRRREVGTLQPGEHIRVFTCPKRGYPLLFGKVCRSIWLGTPYAPPTF